MGDPRWQPTTVVVAELLGQERTTCRLFLLLLLRFGDGGPTVGKSTHKHLTEGDQRFYSSTEEPLLREARDAVNGGRSKKEN